MDLTPVTKDELDYFPEGLYIQVSTVADMFVVQSGHPLRLILELNNESRNDLFDEKTVLPFSKKQIIISLDPFCPAGSEQELLSTIDRLVNSGFRTYIVNNLAHIAMLRNKNVNMIGGPYLYTFNRWAVSWLENQEIGAFITPLENSQRNLENTFDMNIRRRVMITLYAYPTLFRIRFKLPSSYDFTFFSDKENKNFKVNSTPDGSFVMPEEPFSIVDKSQILYRKGFHRILLDFSKTKVRKSEFRVVSTALMKEQVLPGTSRFNWKEGFYSVAKRDDFVSDNAKDAVAGRRPVRKTNSGNSPKTSGFRGKK
jgi:putative protease